MVYLFIKMTEHPFNNIRSQAKTLEEPIPLASFENYCLPLLMFAAGAVI